MAESSDLIQVVCDWVLAKAIAQLGRWQAEGLKISVAINMSARDLLNPNLPATITRLCDQHGVSPSRLKVEITESVIMSHPEQVIEIIEHPVLSTMSYAIDDFGTGYSSLSYLKKLPIREVKIDKNFVIDMAHDADDASIVRSVIELAHSLGHVVVAEGVESDTVLNQLLDLGCDIAQGYYYSPAVEADELPGLIQRIEHSGLAPYIAASGKN
jgi:EAL domain-containing protein (putative c-di-GMP-specific phosphodiesterase class I)